MSKKLKYYIIGADDARRLGVVQFRLGNDKDGYLVHTDDMACATADFRERATEVTEKEAEEFAKLIRK